MYKNVSVFLLVLAGCPYVGKKEFAEEIQDWDGDGAISADFGGPDCRDNDASILNCDADGDGILTVRAGGDDCNDEDATVRPGVAETCDGVDQDCDDLVDDRDPDLIDAPAWFADGDGDGFGNPDERVVRCDAPVGFIEDDRDCDDDDDEINPQAPEFCDDVDQDCDGDPTAGAVDRQDWLEDGDGDGYAPDGASVLAFACEPPRNAATEAGVDCDDGDDTVFPGAPETFADGIDQDCSGRDDTDGDGDGFDVFVDCDDGNPDVNPDAAERCNGIDDDCDLQIDDSDDDVTDAVVQWFLDADGDGRGDPGASARFCLATTPPGRVANDDDCDDSRATVFLGAVEICDNLDNNCNVVVDENAVDRGTYFQDSDGDGHGSSLAPVFACNADAGSGLSTRNDDCNDADASVFPGAFEVCGDAIRQDCSDFSAFDCDSDGFEATSAGGPDCDDADPAIRPFANEVCDGLDNDCDTLFDDDDPGVDLTTIANWYKDADLDGFGDPNELELEQACAPQPGLATNALDCDDSTADRAPGAPERCNSLDDDCDGLADDADLDDLPVDPPTFWLDVDVDGFGDPAITWHQTCLAPAGDWATNLDDCQPGQAEINPFARELCDGVDNDCDGLVDQDDPNVGQIVWYPDNDGDGWGQPGGAVVSCGQPQGFVAVEGDCNDFSALANPGVDEVCDNGIDNDCDGFADDTDPDLSASTTWHRDADGDGYGSDAVEPPLVQCTQPLGYVLPDTDCDDDRATVSPAAFEVCNGIDDDCDADRDDADDDTVNQPLWYADTDRDGWGDATPIAACVPPVNTVAISGDCDDQEPEAFPNGDEVCDGIDNDCDDLVDDADADDVIPDLWFTDADGDGVGGVVSVASCADPADGSVPTGGDCLDSDAAVFPGQVEACDGSDNDCDALVDDADPSKPPTANVFFQDGDGDGFGSVVTSNPGLCVPAPGYVANDDDCDDADILVRPGAVEVCGAVDTDCDGLDGDHDPSAIGGVSFYTDADGDGFGGTTSTVACINPGGMSGVSGDCDDGDAAKRPGATEVCGGGDEDCDGLVDDADGGLTGAPTVFRDADQDGYGDPATTTLACVPPTGFVGNGSDCADADPRINLGAPEVCDGVDNDCDTRVDTQDSSLAGGVTVFTDADGDGHGSTSAQLACAFTDPGVSPLSDDCDDGNPAVVPGATEQCNGLDDDCDGLVDVDDPGVTGGTVLFRDLDGDGLGDAAKSAEFCGPTTGWVADATDCDDADPGTGAAVDWWLDRDRDGIGDGAVVRTACAAPPLFVAPTATGDCDDADASVRPGAIETCDGVDEDCDGAADDNPRGAPQWFADTDGDGWGDRDAPTRACTQPAGTLPFGGDCDDADGAVHPGADEVCGGVDEDCDGAVDDGDPDVIGDLWYTDGDGDGVGAAVAVVQCADPADGSVAAGGDCDDGDAGTFPGGQEVCGGGDEDCDGLVDDADRSTTGGTPMFGDVDGDGFGDPADVISACASPDGYVTNDTDCDDARANVNVGAVEVCDGLDNDCDAAVDVGDPSLVGGLTRFVDGDGDGRGGQTTTQVCSDGPNVSVFSDDCDDGDAAVLPGASETCNGLDDDCDGLVDADDAGAIGTATLFRDLDGDGFGDVGAPLEACGAVTGYVADSSDCDDRDADVHALGTWWSDLDRDGVGDADVSTQACHPPTGFVSTSGVEDCDDGNPSIRPGAVETCDGVDQDCDGTADDAPVGAPVWFADADADGWGDVTDTQSACSAPAGYLAVSGDCDDTDGGVHPGADEVCGGLDEDCDGAVDDADPDLDGDLWYSDGDGDGVGSTLSAVQCADPLDGSVAVGGDCDDADAGTFPGGQEVCGGGDEDCDGLVDDEDRTTIGGSPMFADVDGDGYGDAADQISACASPDGYVPNDTDCDDARANVNVGAVEVCDGLDNDCDTAVDTGDPSLVGGLTRFVDADGDGRGGASTVQVCSDTDPNISVFGDDCDDGNASVLPGATEQCNGFDDDCDGLVDGADVGVTGTITLFRDVDGDGFGDAASPLDVCGPTAGYVADATDCDDRDALLHAATDWWQDADRDGFGDSAVALSTCHAPTGFVASSPVEDCDDGDASVRPGAVETCDGVDQDCDGAADDNVAGAPTWFADTDGDGWGDGGAPTQACVQPSGTLAISGDCDDGDQAVHPGAPEVCDGADNDCDARTDDADADVLGTQWYVDLDGDGYGDGPDVVQCADPGGLTADTDGDCDDGDAARSPAAAEVCNGIDDDCDGVSDDADADRVGGTTWHADTDADGFGDSAGATVDACVQPAGFVLDTTDCDDASRTVFPGAPEICDTVDNDCDTAVDSADSGLVGGVTAFADSDGDGRGSSVVVRACAVTEPNVSAFSDDCDDGDAAILPGAPEVCDGLDNDCDTLVDTDDAGVTGTTTLFRDLDGDGFGDAGAPLDTCGPVAGYVADSSDCDDRDGLVQAATVWWSDGDRDGFGDSGTTQTTCHPPVGFVPASPIADCDDTDATIRPGALELCDTVDQDCDGTADDNAVDASLWYDDADADGWGSDIASTRACVQPAGTLPVAGDCEDGDQTIHPGAAEVCGGLDEDCDGRIDDADGDVLGTQWYVDADSDGYGDTLDVVQCADPGAGRSDLDGDCDDGDPARSPAAAEVCNGIDDDCDGVADDADADRVGGGAWFADVDADGFGDAGVQTAACAQPAGFVADATDCDDASRTVFPGAPEICDGGDNDCDFVADSADTDLVGGLTAFVDLDRDGHGDPASPVAVCAYTEDQRSALSDDCNDLDGAVGPGQDEICNGFDDDCDGLVDSDDPGATGESTYYADVDGDGAGDPGSVLDVCGGPPAGYVPVAGDCDDRDALVQVATDWWQDSDRDGVGDSGATFSACHAPVGFVAPSADPDCDDGNAGIRPGATETCDGIDQDCDSVPDDGAVGAPTWYADVDSDGWGSDIDTVVACVQPVGALPSAGDCDDGDETVNPSADEVCDSADNDCDGRIDDADAGVIGTQWYVDADSDGYGDTLDVVQCADPGAGRSDVDGDCDDGDPARSPAAAEVCNGIDDDCDGVADDADADRVGGGAWFADVDADGFGDAGVQTAACAQPAGFVADATDCDDASRTVFPGAPEICDGGDNDCDFVADSADTDLVGGLTAFVDLDRDGHGDPASPVAVCAFTEDQRSALSDDCNDGDPTVAPGQDEICNGFDDDCDGLVDSDDPGATGESTYYADVDGDGAGDAASAIDVCGGPPAGYVPVAGDCDDRDLLVQVASDWWEDRDRDGVGDSVVTFSACHAPAGFVAPSADPDCDDGNPGIRPGATETCDGIDQDCDSVPDDGAVGAPTWYADVDSDGWGSDIDTVVACVQPVGTLPTAGDCDDADQNVNPGEDEVCDGVDNDCDGRIDDADGDAVLTVWYGDTDSDGFGDAFDTIAQCADPGPGWALDGTDCDDDSPGIHPTAAEQCNGFDDDCDGLVDDDDGDRIGGTIWFQDGDRDGYGSTAPTILRCTLPFGFSANNGDCDDAKPTVFPGAPEICDTFDNDCDGDFDSGDTGLVGGLTGFFDLDRDGHGDPTSPVMVCSFSEDQRSPVSDDCNDSDASVAPGADELCNGFDDDCDGAVDAADSGAIGTSVVYRDLDSDGYGDVAEPLTVCPAGAPGYVGDATDCDDRDGAVNPSAAEYCSTVGVDDDCDGQADDADGGGVADPAEWWLDGDADGYGISDTRDFTCTQPSGYVAPTAYDCDDFRSYVNPGAAEVCNGIDDDCDDVDDAGPTLLGDLLFSDTDGDGFGDPSAPRYDACAPVVGVSVDNAGDCDDGNGALFPGQSLTVAPIGADFDEVSAAVSAACDDATITIYPGTQEVQATLDFAGRRMTLRGVSAASRGPLHADFAPIALLEAADPTGIRFEDLDVTVTTATTLPAVAVVDTSLELDNVRFHDISSDTDGGVLGALNALVTCEDCLFEDNTNLGQGTVGASSASVSFVGGRFSRNHALNGGIVTSFGSEVSLVGTTTDHNTGDGSDGGIIAVGGSLSLTDVTSTADGEFQLRNGDLTVLRLFQAGSEGVAAYTTGAGVATASVLASRFEGATDSDGAVFVGGNTSGTLSGNEFLGSLNVSLLLQGPVDVYNNTFVGGASSDIAVQSTGVNVVNNIFADSAVPAVNQFVPANVDYNLVGSVTELSLYNGGNNFMSLFPDFQTYNANLPVAQWDVHLFPTSVAIDAGVALLPPPDDVETDFSPLDLGAFGGQTRFEPWYTDTDLDGMGDLWELHHFGTLARTGAGDDDVDGANDYVEYVYGTDPNDPDTDDDGTIDDFDFFPLDPTATGGGGGGHSGGGP